MPTIEILSDDLASQIAAGEVVERPASALKELLENSMDAGATRCTVAIEGGGITLLRVLDDGAGMSEEDAVMCLKRHATSKLRSFADLEQLVSYGFRGEALPSIASVSRMLIRTRRADSTSGVELSLEGGLTPKVRPAGCAPGTLVEVRDLFFNVPARRKFLRSSGTEAGHVTEIVESLALANPRLALTLERDGRMVRQWLRVSDRRERAALALDEDFAECRGERGPLAVEAFVTRPERARTGASGLRFLVNGRPIRDRALAVAVAQAYGSVLERGRYPRGVVYLDLPPQLVDFNVHPQKLEVRFADPRAVSDALYQVLASQLGRGFGSPATLRRSSETAVPVYPTSDGSAAVTQGAQRSDPRGEPSAGGRAPEAIVGAPGGGHVESPRASWAHARLPGIGASSTSSRFGGSAASGGSASFASSAVSGALNPYATTGSDVEGGSASLETAAPEAERGRDPGRENAASEVDASEPPRRDERHPGAGEHVEWAALEFIAQVQNTFLICEGPTGLFIIDQHAAAERVTFDRVRRQYQSRSITSQALLFPVEVQLGVEEAEFLEAHTEQFAELGMDVRSRSAQWVSVHGVPRLLERASPERLLRELLAETMRQGGRGFSGAVDLALATLACHSSLRAGDVVAPEEARALLRALDGVDFAGFCPHGRPIVSFTPWSELLRKVGRR